MDGATDARVDGECHADDHDDDDRDDEGRRVRAGDESRIRDDGERGGDRDDRLTGNQKSRQKESECFAAKTTGLAIWWSVSVVIVSVRVRVYDCVCCCDALAESRARDGGHDAEREAVMEEEREQQMAGEAATGREGEEAGLKRQVTTTGGGAPPETRSWKREKQRRSLTKPAKSCSRLRDDSLPTPCLAFSQESQRLVVRQSSRSRARICGLRFRELDELCMHASASLLARSPHLCSRVSPSPLCLPSCQNVSPCVHIHLSLTSCFTLSILLWDQVFVLSAIRTRTSRSGAARPCPSHGFGKRGTAGPE